MFCEAVAVYGIIMAIMMRQKWEPTSGLHPNPNDYKAGFVFFAAGLSAGVCNIFAG